MAKTMDKNTVAKKMFDEGEADDLLIEPERSPKRVTIREEMGVSLIRRRSPAQFIPLSAIVKRSRAQVRLSDFDPEKYPEDKCLLESIRNRGVVSPVMVKEFIEDDDDLLADAKYELIYGHRRVSACKVLGFTTIPAFVVESTVNSAEVTMTENIGVRTLSAYERGREFDGYLTSHDISIRAFSELNGFPHPYVIELLHAYRNSLRFPEIESLYQDGKLYSRDVPGIAELYGNSDEPVRELLIETLPDLSRKQIKEMIGICSSGVSAAGYLNTLRKAHSAPADSPEIIPAGSGIPTGKRDGAAAEKVPGTSGLWEDLEGSPDYVSRQAVLYDCSEEDVRKAAGICREENAQPEMLRCMLLLRKNGGEISKSALDSVRRITSDRNTGKAVSLYISAYEKLNRQRSACEKKLSKIAAENGVDAEIIRKLLGN